MFVGLVIGIFLEGPKGRAEWPEGLRVSLSSEQWELECVWMVHREGEEEEDGQPAKDCRTDADIATKRAIHHEKRRGGNETRRCL